MTVTNLDGLNNIVPFTVDPFKGLADLLGAPVEGIDESDDD